MVCLYRSVHHLVSDRLVGLRVGGPRGIRCLPRYHPSKAPDDKCEGLPGDLPRQEELASLKQLLESLQLGFFLSGFLVELLFFWLVACVCVCVCVCMCVCVCA